MNRFLRLILGLLLAALLSLPGAAVASAHAALIASDPPDNAALATGPDHVSATFNEEMQPDFAAMTVVGPDGNIWSTGSPQVHGTVVSTAVRPLGPVGTYTVNYRATSADGHVVSGAWSFRLTQSGAGEPGPAAAAPAPPSGLPAWPFLAGAVVLIALAAWWAVRRRT